MPSGETGGVRVEKPGVAVSRTVSPWVLVPSAIALCALLWMSHDVFWWMAFVFREPREDMGHGWIVPLFSVALLWQRRRELAAAVGAPSWRGLAFVVVGLLFFWIGARGDQVRITQIALYWTLWSLTYAFFGRALARLTLFPVAYLLFTVPLSFLDIFTVKLRFLTSALAALLLNGVAIPVERVGTGLFCLAGEGFSLDVADPCSGLRSIFALSALTAAYAYSTQKTLLKKWILFLCAVPIAIMGNLVRIFLIAVVAKFFGQAVATGFYHDYSGYVVFIVGIFAVMKLSTWLKRGDSKGNDNDAVTVSPPRSADRAGKAACRAVPILSAAIVLGTAAYIRALPPPAEEPDDFIAEILPPLDGYRAAYPWFCQNEHCARIVETDSPSARPDACPVCGAKMEHASLGELTVLPPDTGFRKCNYYDAMGEVFRVTVVINGKSRQSIHRPEVCLPSQGFSMENGHIAHFRLSGGDTLAVRCVDLRRRDSAPGGRMGQGYYFVSHGNLAASHLARMLISIGDRAFRNRITRWAMVTIFCEESLTTPPEREKAVADFLSQFHPALLSPAGARQTEGGAD